MSKYLPDIVYSHFKTPNSFQNYYYEYTKTICPVWVWSIVLNGSLKSECYSSPESESQLVMMHHGYACWYDASYAKENSHGLFYIEDNNNKQIFSSDWYRVVLSTLSGTPNCVCVTYATELQKFNTAMNCAKDELLKYNSFSVINNTKEIFFPENYYIVSVHGRPIINGILKQELKWYKSDSDKMLTIEPENEETIILMCS